MTMPVYRHLAQRRWEKYHKLLINQRIKQFHIVPDFLPGLTTKADVQLYYRQKPVQPGTILPSLVTEHPPTLRVQTFEPGTRLATIVVVDGDVPDVDNDTFFHRLHFIAANVPIDPTNKNLALSRLHKKHIVVPWLPAHAQMGSPYHRYGIFLMWQLDTTQRVSVRSIRQRFYGGSKQQRDRFNLTDFNTRCHLSPFGFTMFRTQWDDHTKAVMERHGLPGADVVLKPMRIASLKPPAKARGWEARRQGPKYRFLWKYTKRIRGLSTGKRWKGSRG
jgi:large subunit ribosomal protein L35